MVGNQELVDTLEEVEYLPSTLKFEWINRNECLEALVVLLDDGMKFDRALRSITLSDYAYNSNKMLQKQRNQLRKDAVRMLKDIRYERDSADIGDIVRIPKLIPGILPGSTKRDGLRLVDGEIIKRILISGCYRYTIKRLQDGGLQVGNSHMIKAVIKKKSE